MFWWKIWINKQVFIIKKFKITPSLSVHSKIHYSEILIISPTFPSTLCQGEFRLLYQDYKEKETIERRSLLLLFVISQLNSGEWKMKVSKGSGPYKSHHLNRLQRLQRRVIGGPYLSASTQGRVRRWMWHVIGETDIRGLDREKTRKGEWSV